MADHRIIKNKQDMMSMLLSSDRYTLLTPRATIHHPVSLQYLQADPNALKPRKNTKPEEKIVDGEIITQTTDKLQAIAQTLEAEQPKIVPDKNLRRQKK